jgi:D-alanyl-lipoteichoic acid acyltransferase DltB (MBOAT superfamily)
VALWHGVNWTFVVLGALHGFSLMVEKFIQDSRLRSTPQSNTIHKHQVVVQGFMAPRFLKNVPSNFFLALVTFFLVNVTWLFFRAPDFTSAWRMLTSMFTHVHKGAVLLSTLTIIKVSVIVVGMVAFH